MSKSVRRRCDGQTEHGMYVNVEFILDESKVPYEVRTIFRYRNGGTEWNIPLAMFAVLFTKHEVALEDIQLRLNVDKVCLTLTGEDDDGEDIAVEVVLSLQEVKAFYDAADKVT